MEITKREVILSVSIVAIMMIFGFLISGRIAQVNMDKNEKYNKALKINDSELFKYGMDTNVGNAFVYGNLKAVDPVTYPELKESYLYVEKIKEEYTMHTRTVTYTDSKGNAKTKTETYWEWDRVGHEDITSNEVTFLGIKFNTSQFRLPSTSYIETIKISSDVRYKYYGCPIESVGTIFAYLSNGSIGDSSIVFYDDYTIEQAIKMLSINIGGFFFWVMWLFLTGIIIYLFYYLDNNWLNS